MTIPIETGHNGWHFWKVTIKAADGTVVYKDEESDFIGTLNVYWCWDSNDRVWLYNSDDGRVWYWDFQNNAWAKTEWSKDSSSLKPPSVVYPEYAKPG